MVGYVEGEADSDGAKDTVGTKDLDGTVDGKLVLLGARVL